MKNTTLGGHYGARPIILSGDALAQLRMLDADSVHCCVTSPPYFNLRDCGAPDQLGREATPEEYVEKLVGVFWEVRRVLRPDGTLWLNIGDSYTSGGRKTRDFDKKLPARSVNQRPQTPVGMKPKDFLAYFTQQVYEQLEPSPAEDMPTMDIYQNALQDGEITEKEKALWEFVLTAYGTEEFSIKRLEKDFDDAAYGTIRGFVKKFSQLGLLAAQKYGSRIKYRINSKF